MIEMGLSEFKKASFASRLVTLLALTLLFVFTALVLLDNREVEKIFPHSFIRSLAILFGYCVAILSTNYFMALRGRNFIHWKLEILIALNYILFFSAWTLPWLFPIFTESAGPWWQPWRKATHPEQNLAFYGILILQIPLLLYTIVKVRRFVKSDNISA